MTLSEGAKLGRYEILAVIGVGGIGEVCRAGYLKYRRDVEIKVLPADYSVYTDTVVLLLINVFV